MRGKAKGGSECKHVNGMDVKGARYSETGRYVALDLWDGMVRQRLRDEEYGEVAAGEEG